MGLRYRVQRGRGTEYSGVEVQSTVGPRYRVQWGLGTEYSGAEVQSTGAMVQSTQGQSNRVVDNHLCVGQTPAVAHSEGGDKFV